MARELGHDVDAAPVVRIGPYVRGNKIGRGAMADVYEAEDTRDGALVALKLLKKRLTGTSEGVSRFIREGRALQRIVHPNIIRVFDHGFTDEGDFYIAMERLRGVTLDLLVRDEERLDPLRAAKLVAGVARALGHIHELGMVHRDVKPENIFVVEPDGMNEHAKLFDFGLARLAEAEMQDNSVRYTVVGRVMGSAAFMSPEQARGQEVDARADVYALSVTLYEALTGKLPFEGGTATEALHARIHEEPKDVRTRQKGVFIPAVLADVVMRGLSRDPSQRAPDGNAFAAQLDSVEQPLVEWRKSLPPRAPSEGDVAGGLSSSEIFSKLRAPSVPVFELADTKNVRSESRPAARRVWPWVIVALAVCAAALVVVRFVVLR